MATDKFIGGVSQRDFSATSGRADFFFYRGQIYFFVLLFLSLIPISCSEEKNQRRENSSPSTTAEMNGETRQGREDSSSKLTPHGINPDKAIVPGERIGQTHIGESLESVNTRLGKPDSSDAGMGHVYEFRHSVSRNGERPNELDIYGSFDNEATGHYVRQIRITSSWFATRERISTGSPFDSVLQAFPGIRPVAEFQEENESRTYVVYDDPHRGIAFEFIQDANGKPTQCTAIIVSELGRNATQMYIPRHAFKEIEE